MADLTLAQAAHTRPDGAAPQADGAGAPKPFRGVPVSKNSTGAPSGPRGVLSGRNLLRDRRRRLAVRLRAPLSGGPDARYWLDLLLTAARDAAHAHDVRTLIDDAQARGQIAAAEIYCPEACAETLAALHEIEEGLTGHDEEDF